MKKKKSILLILTRTTDASSFRQATVYAYLILTNSRAHSSEVSIPSENVKQIKFKSDSDHTLQTCIYFSSNNE